MKRKGTLLVGVIVLLTACSPEEVPLPQGTQTVRGYVQSVPFSLKKRGTHVLRTESGGQILYYVESREVNLRALEGRMTTLTGTFEKNIDPVLPLVLIVSDVEATKEEKTKIWSVPALGLLIDTPLSWKASIRGKVAEFTASGSSTPILTIAIRHRATTAGSTHSAIPGEEAVLVGQRLGYGVFDDAAKTWTVRVESIQPTASGTDDLLLSFSLQDGAAQPSTAARLEQFRKILRSVRFGTAQTSKPTSSAQAQSSAGSVGSVTGGEFTPCGGPAGVLCPKGFYCKVTEPTTESGVCTKR